MIATVVNHVAEGLTSTDYSHSMNWYRSNFNMPVPNIFSGTTYENPVWYINEGTSYNLSGFSPGFEICVGTATFDFYNDGGDTYNVNTQLFQSWRDPSLNLLVLYEYNFTQSIPAGWTYGVTYAANIGCAGWEVTSSGTYHWRSNATGSPNVTLVDTSVTMSNVPSTAQLSASTAGHIWVEGNSLSFVNANLWKHSIFGSLGGFVGTGSAGSMWIDTSNYLHWIGSNGYDFSVPWIIQQFASIFSNGPTGSVYAGTSKAGMMWVDNQFGSTHIAYIGYDGYKYLVGAGDYPY